MRGIMGEIVSYMERKVQAKGLNPYALPREKDVLKYLFEDEAKNLELLNEISPFNLAVSKPHLFYPGSGSDILFPMLYLDRLFPTLNEINMTFVDLEDSIGMIKCVLDEVGVSFEENTKSPNNNFNNSEIIFFWNKKKVHLQFVTGDIFELISNLPAFDIYFEKAFRIMKDSDPDYEKKVLAKLNINGILISDSGFAELPLQKIAVSTELSAYGEMIMGVKK